MPTLEQIRDTFAADRFATDAAGCEIRLAEPGHAICAMTLQPHHLNAAGTPQGGAIFTLADFAFAVAVNAYAETVTVSLQHDITFLSPAKGFGGDCGGKTHPFRPFDLLLHGFGYR